MALTRIYTGAQTHMWTCVHLYKNMCLNVVCLQIERICILLRKFIFNYTYVHRHQNKYACVYSNTKVSLYVQHVGMRKSALGMQPDWCSHFAVIIENMLINKVFVCIYSPLQGKVYKSLKQQQKWQKSCNCQQQSKPKKLLENDHAAHPMNELSRLHGLILVYIRMCMYTNIFYECF